MVGSEGGHDGAICAEKHLELVHVHHPANPYLVPRRKLVKSVYFFQETNTVFRDTNNSLQGTKYPVQSGPSFEPAYSILNNDSSHQFI